MKKMTVAVRLGAGLILGFLVAVFLISASMADETIIGKAGDMEIGSDAVRAYIAALPEVERRALVDNPDAIARAVRTYMAERLVLKAAQTAKFDSRPEIKAQLDRAHDALLIGLFLQAEATIPADYPSALDLQAFYDRNKSRLVAPPRYCLDQIFISARTERKGSEKLADVAAKLNGQSEMPRSAFAALAKSFSDSSIEAARGGEIGCLFETSIEPEIREALKGLKPGALTKPVRLANGWHILRLGEIKPTGSEPAPLSSIKDQLAAQLRRQWTEKARQDYVSALIAKEGFNLDEKELENLNAELKK